MSGGFPRQSNRVDYTRYGIFWHENSQKTGYINNGKPWEKAAAYYKQLHYRRLALCIKPSQNKFCEDVKVGFITFPNVSHIPSWV